MANLRIHASVFVSLFVDSRFIFPFPVPELLSISELPRHGTAYLDLQNTMEIQLCTIFFNTITHYYVTTGKEHDEDAGK